MKAESREENNPNTCLFSGIDREKAKQFNVKINWHRENFAGVASPFREQFHKSLATVLVLAKPFSEQKVFISH